MENTSKKRYWLRGGLIGVVASIIVFFLAANLTSCWDWGTQAQTALYCKILFPINGTAGGMPGIVSILLYIFYGGVIGWLYGKIKNRKSTTPPSNV